LSLEHGVHPTSGMKTRSFGTSWTTLSLLVFSLTLISLFTGCMGGETDAFSNLKRQDGETPGIHFDPALSANENQMLQDDLSRIDSLQIDGSKVKYFMNIFGGPDSASVNHYLSERVHWLVSSKKDLDRSVILIPSFFDATASNPQVVATNIGAAIWFSAIAAGGPAAGIQIGSDLVEIHSTRAGVIQLGDAYSSSAADPLLRVSTLIHEARHSDCTGGLSRQDLALLQAGKDPVHKDCGHLHADCPAGHPYAGYPACDDHPWGAYAVEADYMGAVSKTCVDCTDQEKKLATVVFADAASRVLNLDGLLAGQYGAPDMSSSDAVLP
jgi:hypothetical protein